MVALNEQREPMPKPKRQWTCQPICGVHGVPLIYGSARENFVYCYCPVDGCRCSYKVRTVEIPQRVVTEP